MTIARGPMPVMEEPERIRDEFKPRRPDTLGSPVDVGKAARPMFCGKDGQPPFQKASIERGVVGDDEHNLSQQVVHSSIVNTMPRNHLIGDPGEAGDFRRERNSGIFEPIPRADHPIDPSVASAILEHTHAKLDDPVALGIGAGGLDIDDCGDELRVVVRRVVFGSRLEPTNDAVIATFDQRVSHLFQRGVHLADIAGAAPPFNGRRSIESDHANPVRPTATTHGDQVIWHIEDALRATMRDWLVEKPEPISFPSEPTRSEIATFSVIVARGGVPNEGLRW